MVTISCHNAQQNPEQSFDERIIAICSPSVRNILQAITPGRMGEIQELRLRQDRPLGVLLGDRDCFFTPKGELTSNPSAAYQITKSDIERVFQNISRHSVYALEEELRNGYVTVAGGHRIGFTGEAVLVNGRIKNLKNISCINIRISREIKGCADQVIPWIIDKDLKTVYHTLIISPPKCGKTTLLRDIIRQLSNGIPSLGFQGVNVGVVDERSELAACYLGVPQNDIGMRSDVLDKCPKAEGMYMLVRAMAPQVIASDEIGMAQDTSAIQEVLNAGIKMITSVHGKDMEDIQRRPVLKEIMTLRLFERLIILGRSAGAGTLEAVVEGRTDKYLFRRRPKQE